MLILENTPQVNYERHNIWQYLTAPKMQGFLAARKAFINRAHTAFWDKYLNDFFNIDTADEWGLVLWGQILNQPRQAVNLQGQSVVLSLEQYRLLLKGLFYKSMSDGTIPSINKFLNVVFQNRLGKVYCRDNFNMTYLPIVFTYQPTQDVIDLIENFDIFPRPACVGWKIEIALEEILLDKDLDGTEKDVIDARQDLIAVYNKLA